MSQAETFYEGINFAEIVCLIALMAGENPVYYILGQTNAGRTQDVIYSV